MRYRREDVVDRALDVLDAYGLGDLSMRRIGAELGVQPSALYHHFASKQLLLAAVSDRVLAHGAGAPPDGPWDARVTAVCTGLRESLLSYRDGAELVATTYALRLGASTPYDDLVSALTDADLGPRLVPTAARTLLHFVFGHTVDEQVHLQAGSVGAIDDAPRDSSDFGAGLELVVDGVRAAVAALDRSAGRVSPASGSHTSGTAPGGSSR